MSVTAKRAGRDSDQFIVRLPDGMRKQVAKVAERDGRSMNAVIVTALAVYLENEKQDQFLGVETAIRELAANQQQTLELVKKIIQSPTVSRPADDMVDMVDRLDRILAIAPKKK
jgi:predicted transcriptional regulator